MNNRDSRVTVFVGHFGSGKTELAINHSLLCADRGNETVVVDLDIVNPFFKVSEKRDFLHGRGIKVISPNFAGTGLDIPSLPPNIYSVFQDKNSRVFFDVGGDDVGAIALGAFYPYFKQEIYNMYYVVNIYRPQSRTKGDIIDMLRSIELRSRLKVTHLINNSNLSYDTEIYDIIKGQSIVEAVSKELDIPIIYIAGRAEILSQLPEELCEKSFPIDIYMGTLWD